jgi:regulator of replication initiation timing
MKMQEAVDEILELGDPAELMDQLQELITENEALRGELDELKKKKPAARK